MKYWLENHWNIIPPTKERKCILFTYYIGRRKTDTMNSKCIRETSNVSAPSREYKVDCKTFKPAQLLLDLPMVSPKAVELFRRIKELDERDLQESGRLYKHFIFCDLPSKTVGSTFLAACFKAHGYTLAIHPTPAHTILPDATLLKTKYNNFFLLSSLSLYTSPMLVGTKKKILAKMNARPDNIHGRYARFIILDSGFKEGIDLFDIKYVHIFEPSVTQADQKQVIGRATRTCGQRGLTFVPNKGWDLHVFIYDLSIPNAARPNLMGATSLYELYLKSLNVNVAEKIFSDSLQQTIIEGSVDYLLNKKVHGFDTNPEKQQQQGGKGSREANSLESSGDALNGTPSPSPIAPRNPSPIPIAPRNPSPIEPLPPQQKKKKNKKKKTKKMRKGQQYKKTIQKPRHTRKNQDDELEEDSDDDEDDEEPIREPIPSPLPSVPSIRSPRSPSPLKPPSLKPSLKEQQEEDEDEEEDDEDDEDDEEEDETEQKKKKKKGKKTKKMRKGQQFKKTKKKKAPKKSKYSSYHLA